jgi:hypothetical protein
MPHSGYMELVVSGAQQHGLPDDYCHQLAAVRVAGEDRHIHTRL